MKQLSKHNALQHAWIDGAEVQVFNKNAVWECDRKWMDIGDGHIWCEDYEYRIKPAEPEKVYPWTKMSEEELGEIFARKNLHLVEIANAAIRRAIDDGQVFTKEHLESISVGFAMQEVKMTTEEWENQREQRDMEIAVAVRTHVLVWGGATDVTLERIIASIK